MKKKRQEDSEEYVCPMDVEMPKGHSFQKGFRGVELHIYEDDLDRLEQVEHQLGSSVHQKVNTNFNYFHCCCESMQCLFLLVLLV